MILYLDTSAFIKLYVSEPGSDVVADAVASASAICAHVITYAEMRAGFAKVRRVLELRPARMQRLVDRFERDWENIERVHVHEPMVRRAGRLADQFGLRGYDSVHLAAAEAVSIASAAPDFRVAVFDHRLTGAARALGLRTLIAAGER